MEWIYKIIDGSLNVHRIFNDGKLHFPNNYGFTEGDTIYFLHVDGLDNRIQWRALVKENNEDLSFVEKSYLRLVENSQAPIALSDEYIVLEEIQLEYNIGLNLTSFENRGLTFSYGVVAKNIGKHRDIFNEIIQGHMPKENIDLIKKTHLDKLLFGLNEVKPYQDELALGIHKFLLNPDLGLCQELISKIPNFESAIGLYYDKSLSIWYDCEGVINRPEIYFENYKKAVTAYLEKNTVSSMLHKGWAIESALKNLINRDFIFTTNFQALIKLAHYFSALDNVELIHFDYLLDYINVWFLDHAPVYFKQKGNVDILSALITLSSEIELNKSQEEEYRKNLEYFEAFAKRLAPPTPSKFNTFYPEVELQKIAQLLSQHKHILVRVGYMTHINALTDALVNFKSIYSGQYIVRANFKQYIEKAYGEPYRDFLFIANDANDLAMLSETLNLLFYRKSQEGITSYNYIQSIAISSYPNLREQQIDITPYVLLFQHSPKFNQPQIEELFFERFKYQVKMSWLTTLDQLNNHIKKKHSENYLISYEMFFEFNWDTFVQEEQRWNDYLKHRVIPYMMHLRFDFEEIKDIIGNLSLN